MKRLLRICVSVLSVLVLLGCSTTSNQPTASSQVEETSQLLEATLRITTDGQNSTENVRILPKMSDLKLVILSWMSWKSTTISRKKTAWLRSSTEKVRIQPAIPTGCIRSMVAWQKKVLQNKFYKKATMLNSTLKAFNKLK